MESPFSTAPTLTNNKQGLTAGHFAADSAGHSELQPGIPSVHKSRRKAKVDRTGDKQTNINSRSYARQCKTLILQSQQRWRLSRLLSFPKFSTIFSLCQLQCSIHCVANRYRCKIVYLVSVTSICHLPRRGTKGSRNALCPHKWVPSTGATLVEISRLRKLNSKYVRLESFRGLILTFACLDMLKAHSIEFEPKKNHPINQFSFERVVSLGQLW